MDKESLRKALIVAVDEYVSAPDAWDDARLAVDTVTGDVVLAEDEETDAMPESTDVYYIMDFVEMTPEGNWMTSMESIDATVDDYFV